VADFVRLFYDPPKRTTRLKNSQKQLFRVVSEHYGNSLPPWPPPDHRDSERVLLAFATVN
jgi:hypothetical protein